MSPECSKQDAELCQTACGERTNIKFVFISVLQSAQQINSGHAYSARMYISGCLHDVGMSLSNLNGAFYIIVNFDSRGNELRVNCNE